MPITITKSKNSKKDEVRLVIKGTTLMYCKTTGYGCLKFGEQAVEGQPHLNMQWETDLVISKDIADKLSSLHGAFKAKTWTQSEFKNTFKIDAPTNDSTIYTFKPYKEAFYKKSGDPSHKIKIIDKQRNDLSEVEIGNGTEATVIISINKYDNKFGTGTSLRLNAIQITNLVEYSSGADYDEDFEFEDDEFESQETTGVSDTSFSPESFEEDNW